MRTILLSFVLALALASMSEADTIYSYVGDTFRTDGIDFFAPPSGVYTLADRITGSFTVADGFVPVPVQYGAIWNAGVLTYRFTDGHQVLTESNSALAGSLSLYTGTPNTFAWWSVTIVAPSGSIATNSLYDRHDGARLGASSAGNTCAQYCDGSHPGTWSVSVPEPMSLLLVVAGIGGLFGARRFYRRRPGAG